MGSEANVETSTQGKEPRQGLENEIDAGGLSGTRGVLDSFRDMRKAPLEHTTREGDQMRELIHIYIYIYIYYELRIKDKDRGQDRDSKTTNLSRGVSTNRSELP